MKKAVSVILIISIVVLLVFSLCACGGENQNDPIIGEWKYHGYSYGQDETVSPGAPFASYLSFSKDGKGTVSENITFTWSYNQNEKTYSLIIGDKTYISEVKRIRTKNPDGSFSEFYNVLYIKEESYNNSVGRWTFERP